MAMKEATIVLLFIGTVSLGGCASSQKATSKLLPAPPGSNPIAVRHNDEGIQANHQKLYENAKQHFQAAIEAAPEMAEAHYNLGMVLWQIGLWQKLAHTLSRQPI